MEAPLDFEALTFDSLRTADVLAAVLRVFPGSLSPVCSDLRFFDRVIMAGSAVSGVAGIFSAPWMVPAAFFFDLVLSAGGLSGEKSPGRKPWPGADILRP